MPVVDSPPERSQRWKWTVCGLLLLATMINYMDRMTLNAMSPRIMDDLVLNTADYGTVEFSFGIPFALGGLLTGFLADRINVRWLYPAALLVWSLAGFLTGFVQGFLGLCLCRALLGLAEAGNWPCALRTTQRIVPPSERTLGNSILQSGAAFGAILTPLLCIGIIGWTGDWRYVFWAIGAVGALWIVLWLLLVKPRDLALPALPEAAGKGERSARPAATPGLPVRRLLTLLVLCVSINIAWHFFRVWLPLFLQKKHDYSENQTFWFLAAYYGATDAGSLSAGFATLYLTRRGLSIHGSRMTVFLVCALLVSLSVVAAYQPAGPLLLVLLLVIGFGALGLFPCYYSFSQELTTRHQGKLTGLLTFTSWTATSILHRVVGEHVKQTGSYREALALAGLAPLLGFAALWMLWGSDRPSIPTPPPPRKKKRRRGGETRRST
ncbi:MAG: MFS transporter [Planctomycetes bacterium]|nr:MFS transporter [Planctomycetota bacterium]